ncbi:histidine kinase [Helicobacter valdiviensis]|uniref:Histidine kinase n=1 Tax=Helicobacter valdiviensis TaxID=1458358 RepID=A0A2W6MYF0_9HELI|nr:PAS domain-containing protein [Helicobacter valdiviensis]PZT49071.1 histidine kinase [Helicobacter valdiviensis]
MNNYSTKEVFLEDNTLITSKTDLKGKIIYGNQDFIKYGEYTEKEFLDKPHNLIRHPQMPKAAFKLLWETLYKKKEFFAFVCNLSKNNHTYWVFANITPSYDEQGNVIGYYSVRRRPSKEGVMTMQGIYNKLLEIEKTQGMEKSFAFALDFLKENKLEWDSFMVELQNKGKEGGYR